MLRLYQREDCPFSQKVRGRLTELGLSYLAVSVPADPLARSELIALSGQRDTPVLADDAEGDERVICDAETIISYLQGKYGAPTTHEPAAAPEPKSLAERPSYGMTRQLPGLAFHAAREKVQALLAKAGFGVVSVVDVRALLESKLDIDIGRQYLVLGTCNFELWHAALRAEPFLGLLTSGNVVITEADSGDAIVSVARPVSALQAVANRGVKAYADRAEAILLRVMTSL